MFTKSHALIDDAVIAVEGATEEQMNALVRELLPLNASIPGVAFGLNYDVFDASDAYQQWSKASTALNIEEGNPFLREFDIRPYAVTLIISTREDPWLRTAVPYVAESIARYLASKTKLPTLLTFNGGEIPYRLFHKGRVLDDYSRFYEPILGKLSEVVREFR